VKHCLVVDDSRVIRKVACKILETMNFAANEAEDGLDALDHCRTEMPDVILLDENMPNMNGLEFLRVLRSQREGTTPIVLLCTMENNAEHIREAMRAGANEYVMKPFDRATLHDSLARLGAV
jgi:two-component system chemotaxis response regulator CheY